MLRGGREKASFQHTHASLSGSITTLSSQLQADGDDGACGEDAEGWAGVEDEEGSADGEREDHTACYLVKGGVDIFEGIVAKAARKEPNKADV